MNVGIFKIQENVVDLILSIILKDKTISTLEEKCANEGLVHCYFLNERHLQVWPAYRHWPWVSGHALITRWCPWVTSLASQCWFRTIFFHVPKDSLLLAWQNGTEGNFTGVSLSWQERDKFPFPGSLSKLETPNTGATKLHHHLVKQDLPFTDWFTGRTRTTLQPFTWPADKGNVCLLKVLFKELIPPHICNTWICGSSIF